MSLSLTFDLEDNRCSTMQAARFVSMSERFLSFLEQSDASATVFVVGELARTHPDLIRRFSAGGHEVGLHGLRHATLGEVGEARLESELREGRALLEDVIQAEVRGFRAPIFSLTARTVWAIDAITAAGFEYSSSVVPSRSPLNGWPGLPAVPFRWASGLIELPCPVGGVGALSVPYLGGVYMRYLPMALIRWCLRRSGTGEFLWSYLHPYDLDVHEPFFVYPHTGRVTSWLLHHRRGRTLERLEAILESAGGPGPTLAAHVRRLDEPSLQTVGY